MHYQNLFLIIVNFKPKTGLKKTKAKYHHGDSFPVWKEYYEKKILLAQLCLTPWFSLYIIISPYILSLFHIYIIFQKWNNMWLDRHLSGEEHLLLLRMTYVWFLVLTPSQPCVTLVPGDPTPTGSGLWGYKAHM